MLKPLLFVAVGLTNAMVSALSANEQVSPDGRYRVSEMQDNGHIILLLSETLSQNEKVLVQLPGNNQFPVWSPDNNFIAFCATFKQRHFITVTDLTGHSWMVAEINGKCSTPAWSADSAWLAFQSKTKSGDYDIYVATAGGTEHRNLTQSPERDECSPVWSPSQQRWSFSEKNCPLF